MHKFAINKYPTRNWQQMMHIPPTKKNFLCIPRKYYLVIKALSDRLKNHAYETKFYLLKIYIALIYTYMYLH